MDRPNRHEMYGPFEVLERVGIGGMATVHRAIERGAGGFEREVALKRLLPHLAEDEAFLRLFVREAKLASMLQHENIVRLYELGRVGASYFISMEYIAGRDLRNAIWRARRVVGPPPIAVTVAILIELCDALDYAHNRRDEAGEPMGLIHRDISPSNLLIDESGHLKVIDFGVAKATQGHLQSQTGGLKGKLSYMPPEMLACRPLDARSDLFSASVIAHELLTTAPLFTGQSEFQTMDRVQRMAPPPPSAKNRDCPPELDAIVLKGLAKDPDRRWSSAAEMRGQLAELAMSSGLQASGGEVAGWMRWAFAPGAVRRPLPLAAPEEGTPSQPDIDASPVVLNERDFEAAWDWLRNGAAPIVLDDVPDVSDRLVAAPVSLPPRVLLPAEEDAPTVAVEVEVLPDTDVVPRFDAASLALDLDVAPRSQTPVPPPPPAWLERTRPASTYTPVDWADGTPSAPPAVPPLATDTAQVRLRPSPLRAIAVVLVAGVAITAGAAYILRGDRRPVRTARSSPAAPTPAAPATSPTAQPAGSPATHTADDAPALVPPDRVKLRRGEPPVLRVAETGSTPPVLAAELCVDRRGRVASVKISTPVSSEARAALTRDLGRWRYHPIERDGRRVAGCFATEVRPVFSD